MSTIDIHGIQVAGMRVSVAGVHFDIVPFCLPILARELVRVCIVLAVMHPPINAILQVVIAEDPGETSIPWGSDYAPQLVLEHACRAL